MFNVLAFDYEWLDTHTELEFADAPNFHYLMDVHHVFTGWLQPINPAMKDDLRNHWNSWKQLCNTIQ